MKNFGRVSVCGSISSYNTNPKNLPKGINYILTFIILSYAIIVDWLQSLLSVNLKVKFFFLVPMLQPAIVFKQLKIEGFIVSRWADKWQSGIERNLNLIKEVSFSFML